MKKNFLFVLLLVFSDLSYSQVITTQKGVFEGTNKYVTVSIDVKAGNFVTQNIHNNSSVPRRFNLAADHIFYYVSNSKFTSEADWDKSGPKEGIINPGYRRTLYTWYVPVKITAVDSIEIIIDYNDLSIMCYPKEGVILKEPAGLMTMVLISSVLGVLLALLLIVYIS